MKKTRNKTNETACKEASSDPIQINIEWDQAIIQSVGEMRERVNGLAIFTAASTLISWTILFIVIIKH